MHGFLVLSEIAVTSYKCTNIYDPTDECRIRWDDPDIGVKLPTEGMDLLIGKKDQTNIRLREFLSSQKFQKEKIFSISGRSK